MQVEEDPFGMFKWLLSSGSKNPPLSDNGNRFKKISDVSECWKVRLVVRNMAVVH